MQQVEQQVTLAWVVLVWLALVAYVGWDLRRIRRRARHEVSELMDPSAPEPDRRAARQRILHDFDQYHRNRSMPLWWRWSRSMMRPGNLVFGLLLGVALIFSALWIEQGTVAQGVSYSATLCLALALLTGVAWVVRRIF